MVSKMFSERYGPIRMLRMEGAREEPEEVSESVVQCLWYDQLFREEGLSTGRGVGIRVVSPGWWNHGEGPDFRGAQIEFDGDLRTGDVEVHLNHGGWRQHGHHMDSRYDGVLLHVVMEAQAPRTPPITSQGREIPSLLLSRYVEEDVREVADRLAAQETPSPKRGPVGHCAALAEAGRSRELTQLIHLAGDWRILFKARMLRERMDRVGPDQAVYEAFLSACGYGHFKHHFQGIARELQYERVCQLGRGDVLVLETAFLQFAGLMPESLPKGTTAVPHFGRLRALRRDRLEGLRPLPLTWRRVGVRPNNNPERRLAGAARFLARTAGKGLVDTLEGIWAQDASPLARRRLFEGLFPGPMGFWATHCTWTGKRMARPSAPLGSGRIRSIIGNVFVSQGLAMARRRKDRVREERVYEFFSALPQEPENRIQKTMLPRAFGRTASPRLDFRMQQGLLQVYQDWCEPNPSCRNCRFIAYLEAR